MSETTEDCTLAITSPIPFNNEEEADNVKNEEMSPIELTISGDNTMINIHNIQTQSRMQIVITEDKMEKGKVYEKMPIFEVESAKIEKGVKQRKQYLRDHGEERYPSIFLLKKDNHLEEIDLKEKGLEEEWTQLEKDREELKFGREGLFKEKARLALQMSKEINNSYLNEEKKTSHANRLSEKEKLWISRERQLIAEERKIFQDEKRILEKEIELIGLERKLLKRSEQLFAEERQITSREKSSKSPNQSSSIYVPVYQVGKRFATRKKIAQTQTDHQRKIIEEPLTGIFPTFFPRVVVARMNFPQNDISEIPNIPLDEDKNALLPADEKIIEKVHVGLPDDFYTNESDAPNNKSGTLTSIGRDMCKKLANFSIQVDDQKESIVQKDKEKNATSSVNLFFNWDSQPAVSSLNEKFNVTLTNDYSESKKPTVLKSRLWDSDSIKLNRTQNQDTEQNGLSIRIENGASISISLSEKPNCSCQQKRSVKIGTEDLKDFNIAGECKRNLSPRTALLLRELENKLKDVTIIKYVPVKNKIGDFRTYYCQDCMTTMRLIEDEGNVQKMVDKFEEIARPNYTTFSV